MHHMIKRGYYDPINIKADVDNKPPSMQGFHEATRRDYGKKRPPRVDRYMIGGEHVTYAQMAERVGCDDKVVRAALKKAQGIPGAITWERLSQMATEIKSKTGKRPFIYSE